ncbi:hypothetical protein POM88_048879 [Heracleum sosnowskyi]|uniref:Uncharacterized protein n=1 Tax=Heracleum sosnowskyi TaxID=360622 RepID=A0AAD8M142_9APIA|nr:hypothetical protein POM88_048879 [Heracleum sosnowskyi]
MTSEYSFAGFKNLREFYYRLSSDPDIQTESSNVVKVFASLHKIEKISIADCFITANPNSEEEDLVDFCEEDFEDCTYIILKLSRSVILKASAELELVRFLLAHFLLLKTMFIHRDCDMEKDVAVKFLEELH